jgi:hypothetical protein
LVGIGRNRIGQVFARHAVKRLAAGHSVRLVEIPQYLIERAVFHHQHHYVVKSRQILPLVGDAEHGTRRLPVARARAPGAKGARRPGQSDKLPA